ncbi:DNA gyrase inhibitor YacG [Vogesella amnigena]|uniref:DNA gyrase inhibitor YacG n=1 Tax=Vogesella amnigena TaxID=1507449 RepID=A0ABV7TS04_9NEIS
MSTDKIVACPQCRQPVAWGPQSPYRPFCSERCRLIDLGQWADESYRVPVSGDDPMRELEQL